MPCHLDSRAGEERWGSLPWLQENPRRQSAWRRFFSYWKTPAQNRNSTTFFAEIWVRWLRNLCTARWRKEVHLEHPQVRGHNRMKFEMGNQKTMQCMRISSFPSILRMLKMVVRMFCVQQEWSFMKWKGLTFKNFKLQAQEFMTAICTQNWSDCSTGLLSDGFCVNSGRMQGKFYF